MQHCNKMETLNNTRTNAIANGLCIHRKSHSSD